MASLSKLSRLETGMIELKKEQADLKKTIMAAVSEVYSQASHRSVDIHIVNVPSLELAHDPQWTREAIVNMLDNAIKYSDENGLISVTMEKLETYVKIDIEDRGIGIPPQEIDKVFNRFYRGQDERIKKSAGMGIGLYLSRKIIEDQGGGLIVKAEVGKGTKFTILLLHSF